MDPELLANDDFLSRNLHFSNFKFKIQINTSPQVTHFTSDMTHLLSQSLQGQLQAKIGLHPSS